MSNSAQKSQKMRLKLKKIRAVNPDDPPASESDFIDDEVANHAIEPVIYTDPLSQANTLSDWMGRWLAKYGVAK